MGGHDVLTLRSVRLPGGKWISPRPQHEHVHCELRDELKPGSRVDSTTTPAVQTSARHVSAPPDRDLNASHILQAHTQSMILPGQSRTHQPDLSASNNEVTLKRTGLVQASRPALSSQ
jgi:hypothetical protein